MFLSGLIILLLTNPSVRKLSKNVVAANLLDNCRVTRERWIIVLVIVLEISIGRFSTRNQSATDVIHKVPN